MKNLTNVMLKVVTLVVVYYSLPVILLLVDVNRGWSLGDAGYVVAGLVWLVYAYHTITITLGSIYLIRKWIGIRKECYAIEKALDAGLNRSFKMIF